jgi:hypothetical protein
MKRFESDFARKSLWIAAAVLLMATGPASAQPKMPPISQKIPFISGILNNTNDHPGNAVCFPPTVAFFPYVGYAVGKTTVSAADITLFTGTADPPDPPSASEMIPYALTFQAGKCRYFYAYPNINPGITDLAQITAQHNPNTYFLISKRQDCWSFDKTLYTDPIFANIEYECEIRFHGVITK